MGDRRIRPSCPARPRPAPARAAYREGHDARGDEMNRRAAPLAAAAAVAALLAVAACSSDEPPSARTTSPSPTPTGPLSGPALAVKIDNTAKSHPHVGIAEADVVYVRAGGGRADAPARGLLQRPAEGGRPGPQRPRVRPRHPGQLRADRLRVLGCLVLHEPAPREGGAGQPQLRRLQPGLPPREVAPGPLQRDRRHHRRCCERPRAAPVRRTPDFEFGPAARGRLPRPRRCRCGGRRPACRSSGTPRGTRTSCHRRTGSATSTPRATQHGAATVVVQVVETHASKNRDVTGAATPVVRADRHGQGHGAARWEGVAGRRGPAAAAADPTAFTLRGAADHGAPDGPVWVLLVAPGQSVTVG